jgi:hypothetical protein
MHSAEIAQVRLLLIITQRKTKRKSRVDQDKEVFQGKMWFKKDLQAKLLQLKDLSTSPLILQTRIIFLQI